LSHSVLRLRGLGVPIVLIEPEQAGALPYGQEVWMDASAGVIASPETLSTGPSPPTLPVPGVPITTRDGLTVDLRGSVGSADGAALAVANGASSIGLVRSEYLFPDSGEKPDTQFLLRSLGEVCQAAQGLAVTVRLVDIAGDKCPLWAANIAGITGAFGLQGARLYDLEPVREVLAAELEAIAQLARNYDLRVLIPYLTRLEELERWKGEIAGRLCTPLRIGAMLETPAAALAVGTWLGVADFVALGCNDLMQSLFAADRDQQELRAFLDPYCPTLHRFLRHVAHEAGPAVGQIQVCGLLPQLTGILPILLGLGYRVFSVDPVMIPWLAAEIAGTTREEAEKLAADVCAAQHSGEVRNWLGLPFRTRRPSAEGTIRDA
jgi:phosphoenolpyruvate-protein kinase (PTS system EI component)